MKSTGVVRRIDELGRIVVPKEMRRVLHIHEGDSLEIKNSESAIVIKKYSLVESINYFVTKYVEAVHSSSKKDIIVTDDEKILAVSKSLSQNLVGKKITNDLEKKIKKGDLFCQEMGNEFEVTNGYTVIRPVIVKPISVYGDLIGAVIVFGENKLTDVEKMLANMSSIFIGKYLEN